MNQQSTELRQKNIRLAITIALFALFVFATSFPFWQNVFTLLGTKIE